MKQTNTKVDDQEIGRCYICLVWKWVLRYLSALGYTGLDQIAPGPSAWLCSVVCTSTKPV